MRVTATIVMLVATSMLFVESYGQEAATAEDYSKFALGFVSYGAMLY